jgi:hypothetical protein
MRARATPTRTAARKKTSFHFTVTTVLNGATVPLPGARITLRDQAATTAANGKATLGLALPHAGSFKAQVTKLGFAAVKVTLHATARRVARRPGRSRRPTFTG